jgi:hypothetical protein
MTIAYRYAYRLIFVSLLLASACSEPAATAAPDEEATAADSTAATAAPTDLTYYPWVDQLNLRAKPAGSSRVLTTLTVGVPLTYRGVETVDPETFVLRGVVYTEPWLEVTTADSITGWVFGGAVKRENEAKGNAPLTDESFNFPNFGRFDLSAWTKGPDRKESGGDAEITTHIYQRAGERLEISQTELGEYGYGRSYRLLDSKGKVLKTRELDFSVDPKLMLTETVTDYTTQPPTQYQRTQAMPKHYLQLNARPAMAAGPWKTTALPSNNPE